MAVKPSTFGVCPQFELATGAPAVGYKLFTYLAGTNTKVNTYTDSTGATANANPIVLNAMGMPGSEYWWTTGQTYKTVLALDTDTDPPSSPVRTWDNLTAMNDVASAIQDEWVLFSSAPSYVSATSFTVTGNQSTIFQVGRRLKTSNTGGTVYSTIISATVGANTTVVVSNDSGTLDSGLSAVSYGLLSVTSPSAPVLTRLPGYLNLLVKNDATTPNSKLNISADEMMLRTGTVATLLSAVSANADITVSGAGGLDTGSEAANTTYFVWAIWNGATFNGLLSTSSTAPTMPSGYTYKKLLGSVRNDGSSNFIAFYQKDDVVNFDTPQAALSGGTSTSLAAVAISTWVPSIARSVFARSTCNSPASAGQHTASVFSNNSGSVGTLVALAFSNGGAQNGYAYGELPLRWPALASNIYYIVSTSASADIHVMGYRLSSLS